MKKILYPLLTSLVLLSANVQAQSRTEAQIHAYREAMQQAGEDLHNQRNSEGFNKIKSFAEQNYPEAQYILATLYEDGTGTEVNLNEARRWYQAAAMQSDNPQVAELAKQALNEMQPEKP